MKKHNEPVMIDFYQVKRKGSQYIGNIFFVSLVVGLCFAILYPLFKTFPLVFGAMTDLGNPDVIWLPKETSTLSFKAAYRLSMGSNFMVVVQTLLYAASITLIQIFMSAMAGYSLARINFRGKNLIFFLVVLTFLVPPQSLLISQYIHFKHFDVFGLISLFTGSTVDLINQPYTLYLLAILGFGVNQSLFVFIFRQFFVSLPTELEEAALIDGCGFYRTYFKIMLPNAMPSILTVGVLSFVWNYGDTYYTNYFHPEGPYLGTKLMNAFNPSNTQFVLDAVQKWYGVPSVNTFVFDAVKHAAALIYLVPLLIVYFLVQKRLVENLERSGIVG